MTEILHKLVRSIQYVPYFLQKKTELGITQQNYALMGRLTASLLHDILTPITSLNLGSSLLQEDPTRIRPVIKNSADQVTEFVEIMKEFLHEYEKEKQAHINNEIRRAIQLMRHKAQEHGIKIRFLEFDQVHSLTHPIYMYQILINLITNAIDASIASERKEVIIVLKKQKKSFIIECKDFGSGISEEQLKKIFSPGFTTKEDGFGLGLYSVRRIIKQHLHGNFSVHSEPEQGSLFSCQIPIRG